MTTMNTAILVLRLLAASQVLLIAVAIAVSPNPYRTRVLGVALVFGAIVYLVSAPVFGHINLQLPTWLVFAADAIPPILFFFTWDLFEDDRKPALAVWVAAVAYLVATLWYGIERDAADFAISIYFLIALQLTKLGFAIGAILVVWRGREDDVVEDRLKLRRVFAAGIGVIVFAVVATELITVWNVPELVELVGAAAIFVASLMINLAFLRFNPTMVLRSSWPLPCRKTSGLSMRSIKS